MEEEIRQFKIVKNPRKCMSDLVVIQYPLFFLSTLSRVLKKVKELIFRKIFIKNSVQSLESHFVTIKKVYKVCYML